MTDIAEQINALRLDMNEHHEELKFKVLRFGAGVEQQTSEINSQLTEIHAKQLQARRTTQHLLQAIALEAGLMSATPHQQQLPQPSHDPMDLPAMILRARGASDDVINAVNGPH